MKIIKNTPVIANNIIKIRLSHNLSRKRLSRYLGVTPDNVTEWECGKGEIPIDIAEKFACMARLEISEFCSKGTTVDEIRHRQYAFDAKSIFEIEQKYPDLMLR